MWLGNAGNALLWVSLIASFLTMGCYAFASKLPKNKKLLLSGRLAYTLTAVSMMAVFGVLGYLMYMKTVGGVYRFAYVFEHTSNDLQGLYRFSATWGGQEGSFLLWAMWTSLLGFLVFSRAGKYESRVMPIFVSVLSFLALILIKQSPFALIPQNPDSQALAHGFTLFPIEGQGLNASLQNYWMTIHPPTIFFGFASLAVPFSYAVAALIWKDYEDWTPRVMPYSLLTCCTLGVGLFMGGYWAYETQGWHGFWGWDPVENASFFPWLAITALVHGSVVQKDRGGMAKTNVFLGLLAFWLFLLGTFLTRSGALAGKDPTTGEMLSVHAFANIGKSGLSLMIAMLVGYGVLALGLWLFRLRSIPGRKTTGDSVMSRDFAFFMAVILMLVSCAIITMGTTTPLIMSWMHKEPSAPQPVFYNRAMMPISILTALMMGVVPWLAWKKTSSETFLKKMMIPWFAMLAFGFFMLFWILGAQHDLQVAHEAIVSHSVLNNENPIDVAWESKQQAWINPAVQRMSVLALSCLGFLAAFSNSMLAYKVFRAKPINAGGWLAHVGIGLLMLGAVVSNTFERTVRFDVKQGEPPVKMFGYEFAWEGVTGKPYSAYPINPEYDKENAVQIRVTPPENEKSVGSDGTKTFIANLRNYVSNFRTAESETDFERISWPHIQKFLGHDLYVGMATTPSPLLVQLQISQGETKAVGEYTVAFVSELVQPQKRLQVNLKITTHEGKVIEAHPAIQMNPNRNGMGMSKVDIAVPELLDENNYPGVVQLDNINAKTGVATIFLRLPGLQGAWVAPLEVTYKPWVNLVWIGVIIMGCGIALATLRRTIEAKKLADGVLSKQSRLREVGENGAPDSALFMTDEDESSETSVAKPEAPPVIAPPSAKPGRRRPTTT